METEKIKDAIKKIIAVKSEQDLLEKFAKEKYYAKFDNEKIDMGTWKAYDSFTIKSENEIVIHYSYGIADMEYNDSFNVEIK